MTQLGQPFHMGEVISRRDVSNVSLSPTTDNKRVTIALEGAGPSLAFQEDLVVGRSFREPRFETSAYESLFSNIEVSTRQFDNRAFSVPGVAGAFARVERRETSSLFTLDERSPATETFRVNRHAVLALALATAREEPMAAFESMELESPSFRPAALQEFEARGFVRRNRWSK